MSEVASIVAPTPLATDPGSRRDLHTIALLVIAVAAVPALGFRASLGPYLVATAIAAGLLWRGDQTGARLFAFAVAVRMWAATCLSIAAGSANSVFPDEDDFLAAAGAVLDSVGGTPVTPAPPGFGSASIGYLYAPFVALGGRSIESLRGASVLAGAVAVLAVWRLGCYVSGRRAARRAALVMCVLPGVVVWSSSGLKEGFVLAFLVVGVCAAVRVLVEQSWPGRLVGGAIVWIAVVGLSPLRDSAAFLLAGAAIAGAIFGAALGLRDVSPMRSKRRMSLMNAAVLSIAVTTALWVMGYGVMGVRALDALRPGALDKAHELEVGSSASDSASGRVEATSVPEPATPELLRRLASRLPSGFGLTMLRPYPWETASGSLGRFSGPARGVIIPDQVLWYLLLIVGATGAIRLARRHLIRAVIPAVFVGGATLFYSLAQGNVGTAYRLRTILVPIILIFAFVPARPRRSLAAERALIVLPTLGEGGTERHAIEVARELESAGVQTRLLAFRGGIHEAQAGEVAPLKVVGRKSRFDIFLPYRAARAYRAGSGKAEQSADSVWLTYLFAGNFWGGLAARIAGAPLITNIRTSHLRSVPARMIEPLVVGEVVAVNSEAVAKSICRRGIDANRVCVIRNGVDVGAMTRRAAEGVGTVREDLGISQDEFLVVVPGRIDPLKAQLVAVEAFRLLVERADSRCRLVLAGAASLAGEIEYSEVVRQAATDLGEQVLMPGMVENLPALLAEADVVLLTSEHEGLPNALLEAMSLGAPAVATKAGGIPEVVADGETGILCEVGDARAIADALDLLRSDSGLRNDMGQAGLERARQKFSLRREREELLLALRLAAERAEADDSPAVPPSVAGEYRSRTEGTVV